MSSSRRVIVMACSVRHRGDRFRSAALSARRSRLCRRHIEVPGVRTLLYEAAKRHATPYKQLKFKNGRFEIVKLPAMRQRSIALARRLAVIMHPMLRDAMEVLPALSWKVVTIWPDRARTHWKADLVTAHTRSDAAKGRKATVDETRGWVGWQAQRWSGEAPSEAGADCQRCAADIFRAGRASERAFGVARLKRNAHWNKRGLSPVNHIPMGLMKCPNLPPTLAPDFHDIAQTRVGSAAASRPFRRPPTRSRHGARCS